MEAVVQMNTFWKTLKAELSDMMKSAARAATRTAGDGSAPMEAWILAFLQAVLAADLITLEISRNPGRLR